MKATSLYLIDLAIGGGTIKTHGLVKGNDVIGNIIFSGHIGELVPSYLWLFLPATMSWAASTTTCVCEDELPS